MAVFLNQQTFALAPITVDAPTTTTELFIATTNATPTTLADFGTIYSGGLTTNSVLTITGTINGLAASPSNSCSGTYTACFSYDYLGGSFIPLGTPTVVVKSGSTGTFAISGTVLTVTGIAVTNFAWHTVFTTMIN